MAKSFINSIKNNGAGYAYIVVNLVVIPLAVKRWVNIAEVNGFVFDVLPHDL
jgi:hypothetical protein